MCRILQGEQDRQGYFEVLDPAEAWVGILPCVRREEDDRQDDERQYAVIRRFSIVAACIVAQSLSS